MKIAVVDDVAADRNPIYARLIERGIDAVEISLNADVEKVADDIEQIDPDCVLLDFVLTESRRVRFRSHVLARALRDRALDGGRPMPVVLYSSAPKFKQFYDTDQTSHELYDYRFDKEQMQGDLDGALCILRELRRAYNVFIEAGSDRAGLIKALECPAGIVLDNRMGHRFAGSGSYPVGELVGYCVREIIEQPHPLVDEKLLAARLGVELNESSRALIAKLPQEAVYRGVCCRAFERWWWQVVDEFLFGLSGEPFRAIFAPERVELLQKKLLVNGLVAASPIQEKYQTTFWSVCEGYQRPVDINDAFVASNSSTEAWHDRRYLSIDAALRGVGEERSVFVDASDEARFAEVKDLLGA